MATFPSIEPSYGFTKTQTPLKQVVKLGDGYEQRLKVGLNQNPFKLSVAFNNITETDADTIETFLTARADDNASFDFTAPGEATSKKYICDSHRKVINFPNRASITCEFREVYEP